MAYAFFFTLFLERTDLSTILQIKNLNNPSKCEYPSHVVRTYEDVARILGTATIETHYSELGFTPSFRKAETALLKDAATDGRLSQNGWIGSEKFDSRSLQGRSPRRGYGLRLVADVPGSNPGFRLRRPAISDYTIRPCLMRSSSSKVTID